jgi:SAM-dependent methyltransferase
VSRALPRGHVSPGPFERAWVVVADAAGVGAGTSLLDLGCGTGAFCSFAARRGARVHGVDAEPYAIARALEELPGADLQLGLMERLPWPDSSFDVVTSFNALQYALDPALALGEACRVIRPAGRIAICKWAPPAHNEFFAFLLSLGAACVRSEDLPRSDPVEEMIGRASLDVLATGDVPVPIELAGAAGLVGALEGAGIESESSVAASSRDVVAAAGPYLRDDGTYRFDNSVRYWVLGSRKHA